jgi:hypothetical protein
MSQVSFRRTLSTLAFLVCAALGFSGGLAQQQPDPKYIGALGTVYAGAQIGKLIKEWCDERAPALKVGNAKALEAWRTQMELPVVEAHLGALLNGDTSKLDGTIEGNREAVYTQLDGASTDAEADCKDLEKTLKEQFNLKTLYAKEYAYIATVPFNPKGATSGGTNTGTDTGTGSSTGNTGTGNTGTGAGSTAATSSTTASKLPVMPPFDYAQFVKLKLDPNKEPIPDQYHCYAEIRGEKYTTYQMTLQILPGRKYRLGIGSSVSEGTFRMEDRYYLVFTSGALASKRQNFYSFSRREGATLRVYDLGSEENQIDFECFQRGGAEQIQQLKFKRKDPQPGSYACVTSDGSNKGAGKLEILSNRKYRYNNTEGSFKPDITGDFNDDYSDVRFTGGQLDDSFAFYEEDEAGQQKYDFGGNIKLDCLRQVAPRPNPKFGANKAPPAPGSGGLEGRYFYGRQQFVDINNNLACQGICYSYLIFQKNGYVYSDDLEDTEGLEDADCTRTYPSGIPVCETYTLKGNILQVGIEKPESFTKTKTGLKIDGDDWNVLEPLDGLKFNLAYYSRRIYGAVIGTGGGSSNTDLALRKDGRFTRESSNDFFFGATDTGTSTGSITASVGGSSSRSNNGSYKVYGNTIEFKYDDGRVVKQFMFLPSGRGDLTFLHIGGSIYWEDKPEKK